MAIPTVIESRLKLQEVLEEILGSRNVYFQPTENIRMQYPAIVYSRSSAEQQPADNHPYINFMLYDVTLIDRDPDDGLVQKIMKELPGSRYYRHYASQNLHHDVFVVATM